MIGILDRIFPEYADCFSEVFVKTSRELPKNYSIPEEIAELDLLELTEFLSKHFRGRLGMSHAEQIQQYAKGTFGIGLAVDAFALELRLLMEQIEFIEEQVAALDAAIEQVLDELRAEHVPGHLAGRASPRRRDDPLCWPGLGSGDHRGDR